LNDVVLEYDINWLSLDRSRLLQIEERIQKDDSKLAPMEFFNICPRRYHFVMNMLEPKEKIALLI
jgi:hypothetical protein